MYIVDGHEVWSRIENESSELTEGPEQDLGWLSFSWAIVLPAYSACFASNPSGYGHEKHTP